MNQLEKRYEVTQKDLIKEKSLKYGAVAAPFLFSIVPFLLFFILSILSSATPTIAMFFFLSLISLGIGLILGLIVSGGIMYYRSKWLANIRERIAVDGIKAEEVDWFKNELTSVEKKALKEVEKRNLLLADAFRDTLAARLTATRIRKATNYELLLAKRRQNKLKYLKSSNSETLAEEINKDIDNLQKIKSEAEEMNIEAETRLQMIEAAARRGSDFVDNEIALKKLSARTAQLPLALQEAKETVEISDEIRKELDAETDQIFQ